jgi:hypothetical protein
MPDFGSFRGFGEKLMQGQTPTQLGLIGSLTDIDPDAQLFFNRVSSAGGTLSATEILATNKLVTDFKLYGLWNSMVAIYPMVGASGAACSQNLKSASFTGTFMGGWTFSSTGALGNGSTGYMKTGVIPSTDLLINSTHLSYYSRTNISASQVEMGVGTVNPCYLTFSFGGLSFSGINGPESQRPSAANPTTGLLIGSRISSAEEKYYTNNVSQTRTQTSVAITSIEMLLGCYNSAAGYQPLYYSTKECAFASIGNGLTPTQASDMYNVIVEFQTTLGRQV